MSARIFIISLVAVCCVLAPAGADEGGAEPVAPAGSINIVEAGADPRGLQPIDELLARLARPGATIWFPPGRYRLGRFAGGDQVRLLGHDATLVPDQDGEEAILHMQGTNWEVAGFELDYRGLRAAPTVVLTGGNWRFARVVIRGRIGTTAATEHCRIEAHVDAGTTGTMERVYLPDGSAAADVPDNTLGLSAGPEVEGTLHIDGLWMEGFAESAALLSNIPGRLIIENSYFRNNNNAGIRVGGGSVVRRCVVIKDNDVPIQRWSGVKVAKGIWVNGEKAHGRRGELLIEDCDFWFSDPRGAGDIILAGIPSESIVIRNCRIRNDLPGRVAIRVHQRVDLRLEDLTIWGTSEQPAIVLHPYVNLISASGRVGSPGGVSNVADLSRLMVQEPCETALPEPPMPPPPPPGHTPRP